MIIGLMLFSFGVGAAVGILGWWLVVESFRRAQDEIEVERSGSL